MTKIAVAKGDGIGPEIMEVVLKIFSTIKKVFSKEKPKENFALRDALNKVLPPARIGVEAKSVPAPVSLDILKEKPEEVRKDFIQSKDRAASGEAMDKLKNLISEKIPNPTVPTPQKSKEVPEDVLRKILE